MSTLKWTVELKLNDASIATVEESLDVERFSREVLLTVGKKATTVKVAPRKDALVLYRLQANNAKAGAVAVSINDGEEEPLEKPLLYAGGIGGLPRSSKDSRILSKKPTKVELTNKSANPVTVEIVEAWKTKKGRGNKK
jgi:hypothetical protein